MPELYFNNISNIFFFLAFAYKLLLVLSDYTNININEPKEIQINLVTFSSQSPKLMLQLYDIVALTSFHKVQHKAQLGTYFPPRSALKLVTYFFYYHYFVIN